MFAFSREPQEAAREMEGVLFYLTAFAYIDGSFDRRERSFIQGFIQRLAEAQVTDTDSLRQRIKRDSWAARLTHVFERIDNELKEMWDEPTAEGEQAQSFVRSRIKLRCFEIFESFAPETREILLQAADHLLAADGVADPEEVRFRAELVEILEKAKQHAEPTQEGEGDSGARSRVVIHPAAEPERTWRNHPSLTRLERHYPGDPDALDRLLAADLGLIERFTRRLEEKRDGHGGALAGYHRVQELAGRPAFLDGHVHVIPPTHPAGYDLTVLGDLHGCYSCLKGAVMQSDFLGKVERFRENPDDNPEPLLVLLGDYIDRGLYSYNGVLRGVLGLAAILPDHVIALRGNHEYYIEHEGQVYGGVRPAEAIDRLRPYAPLEVFQAYRQLFETMPNMLLFDETLFVHAGIPRDAELRERYRDLSSLNDSVLRFQMMWSDPSSVDFVPDELQASSNRFAFGRDQARAFMHRIGVTTLVRGHEKVDSGFEAIIDEPDLRVLTLFSAGGANNEDLPPRSSYRSVTPKALTIRYREGEVEIEPWTIDYESYNDPELNEFFASEAELE